MQWRVDKVRKKWGNEKEERGVKDVKEERIRSKENEKE